MKETKLGSENFIIYVKKATAFIPGLRLSVEVTQIIIQRGPNLNSIMGGDSV